MFLDVTPKEGMAVVFFPTHSNSRHAGMPVTNYKWIAQQCVRVESIPNARLDPTAKLQADLARIQEQ